MSNVWDDWSPSLRQTVALELYRTASRVESSVIDANKLHLLVVRDEIEEGRKAFLDLAEAVAGDTSEVYEAFCASRLNAKVRGDAPEADKP